MSMTWPKYRSVLCATLRDIAIAITIIMAMVSSHAQLIDERLPIEVDADSTGANARTGQVTFTNIAIRQGNMSITARHAESTSLDFENSEWRFEGNIKINSPKMNIDGERLMLVFKNKRIDSARMSGAPLTYRSLLGNLIQANATSSEVTFFNNDIVLVNLSGSPITLRQSNAQNDQVIFSEAETIEYDAQTNNLKLEGNAKLSESGNQITGNRIIYNLGNQRVVAAANESGDGRVHITINPSERTTQEDTNDAQEGQEP